jgi:hypothetical protein
MKVRIQLNLRVKITIHVKKFIPFLIKFSALIYLMNQ